MADQAVVDVVDAIATVLVERAYVALQAQLGVDDTATRRGGAITDHPVVRRRRDTSFHYQVGNIGALNERLAAQGYPAFLGSNRFNRDNRRRNQTRAGRVDSIQVDPRGLAWIIRRRTDDEIIALGVAAVGPQSAFAEVERRGARTNVSLHGSTGTV